MFLFQGFHATDCGPAGKGIQTRTDIRRYLPGSAHHTRLPQAKRVYKCKQ